MVRKIPHLRWWITGMLFLSTVINYIDRQTLSILARTIQDDLGMSDLEYSYVVQAFLLAYTVTFIFAGRITDWLGVRISLAGFIIWWSLANMATSLSRSALSLGAFRFLLGVGEPGNYTAAPKAVSEWFPPKERGLVVGIYTAGATVGATIAPPLIAFTATSYGWRTTFVITGALGLLWVIPWLWLYRRPQEHTRITNKELALISPADTAETTSQKTSEWKRWKVLLSRKETWLLLLESRNHRPGLVLLSLLVSEIPQRCETSHITGSGNAGLAGISRRRRRKHRWRLGVGSANQTRNATGEKPSNMVMTVCACLLPLSPLVALSSSVKVALAIASIAALAHLAWQVTLGALIIDLYPSHSVATAFGIVAAGSGLGGMLSTNVVGHLVTSYSYTPVFIIMGVLHPCALLLIRRLRSSEGAGVNYALA